MTIILQDFTLNHCTNLTNQWPLIGFNISHNIYHHFEKQLYGVIMHQLVLEIYGLNDTSDNIQ